MDKQLNCVLLIDDDEGTNYFNQVMIKKSGIARHTQITLNGREAIEYLTNTGKYQNDGGGFPRPELILLDINMPVMDGWDFMNEYQKLNESQKGELVIVMLTTSTNPDDMKRASAISEVSGFRNKPLSVAILTGIMEEFFSDQKK